MRSRKKKNKIVYKNKWFKVIKENNYYICDENNKQVMIIPIVDKKNLLLIKQFRVPLNRYTLEFPAGGLEKNENYKEAAIRELKEETGINILNYNRVKKLTNFSINPQRNKSRPNIFFIDIEKREYEKLKKKSFKNNEIKSTHLISIQKFIKMIIANKIISSFMISAFFYYALKTNLNFNKK